jgi:HAMP domain-containing protein
MLIGRLQCRFVGFLLGYFLLLMFTLIGILVVPPIVQLSFHQEDFSIASAAATQLLYLHSRLWPALGLVLVLFVAHSVVFSHRIAGPLYRIRRLFKEIGAGDLAMHVRIRRKDYLHWEVDAINGMLRGLEHKVRVLSDCENRASSAVRSLREQANEPVPAACEELERSLEGMRECLRVFNVDRADSGSSADVSASVAEMVEEPNAGASEHDGGEVMASVERKPEI